MKHAEHFLVRMERLVGAEVDLALRLYRDPQLIRRVAAAAALPADSERFALSLDDAKQGPFLVVTRSGDFVTCLGHGMTPGRLPVVPRSRLDSAARQVSRERTQATLAEHARHGESRLHELLRKVFVAPASVSREDFLEVARWEPLLGPAFLETYIAMGIELADLGEVLQLVHLPKGRRDHALHRFWNLVHAAGHMALLGSMTADRQAYAKLTTLPGLRAGLTCPLVGTGVITFMLKGAWAAGRLGKMMLPDYKRALARDVALYELFDTLLALLALGRRSSGLRAEIRKAILAAPGRAETPQAKALRVEDGDIIEASCALAARLLDADAAELEAGLLRVGAAYFEGDDAPLDDPAGRDLARTLPLMSRTDGISEGRHLAATLHLVAASARGNPEQFYLPATLLAPLDRPWKPADTLALLEPIRKTLHHQRRPTRRAGAKVGRNAPCPCGSSDKHKRCCGR